MSTVAYNLFKYVVCSPEGPEGLINEVVLCSEVISTNKLLSNQHTCT